MAIREVRVSHVDHPVMVLEVVGLNRVVACRMVVTVFRFLLQERTKCMDLVVVRML
jgi:hypothetical protein